MLALHDTQARDTVAALGSRVAQASAADAQARKAREDPFSVDASTAKAERQEHDRMLESNPLLDKLEQLHQGLGKKDGASGAKATDAERDGDDADRATR